MANFLIGIWGAVVLIFAVAAYFSPDAASLEPFGRYLYMGVLVLSIITLALGLIRPLHDDKRN